MFSDQISEAIDAAHGGRRLDDLSRLIWRGLSEGQITEDAAQELAERIHARRALNSAAAATGAPYRPPAGPTGRPSIFGPPRRPQRPPIRSKAIERRRRVAASGAVPPQIATRFTPAEIAVLSILAAEVRARGRCDRCIDEIAARAGCSRSTAKNAIRTAARIGIIRVTQRPRRGQKNLPNVVEVTDPAWRTWIKKRGNHRADDRGQISNPHGKPVDSYRSDECVNAKYVARGRAHTHDSSKSEQGRGGCKPMRQEFRICGSMELKDKTHS